MSMPHFDDTDFDDQLLKDKKILVAEDEVRLRTIVAMMIEELGAEVITVPDGLSALELYCQDPASIDLVLLDMRMAGLSGVATFERLLEFDPDVKVVLSSGVLPEEELFAMIENHGAGFIEKPFNLDRLTEVLCKVLQGETAVIKH